MFKVNEYFDGKVKSLAFENKEGAVTAGVMAPGEFEFGTSTVEYMTVISGAMLVLLPHQTEWKTYKPYETFIVEKDSKFKVKVMEQTAYKCVYK
ncbi:MAG: pyrimidine/purine nucleoside phosphorylase [Bacteroidales bacterium]|nr:pyrimidine/purine nucleoside phosphorylase [Bacteroidales bacterium]